MKLTIDDVVICLALLLGILTSLILAIANESWGTHFSSHYIAFLASISVAALIYRFLGGNGDSKFEMGVLKVGGSAAILIGATWFLGDRIKQDTALYQADTQYRPVLDRMKSEIDAKDRTIVSLRDRTQQAEDRLAALEAGKSGYAIEQVRRMRPDDPFVSAIRRMTANEDPPFRQTMRDMAALVTLNDAMIDSNVYRICIDTQERLFEGLETQKDRLRVRRTFADGETRFVDMVRGGTIASDANVCSTKVPRSFHIQITCADAARLFPDRIERCAGLKAVYRPGFATIRGERITLGALPPR